jgi:hypothetical protein
MGGNQRELFKGQNQGQFMYLNELQNGQTVLARIGLAGRDKVEWENNGHFIEHTLYVQRNKKREVCIVTTQNCAWAEYTPKDLCSDTGDGLGAELVCEEYYMQIQGLVK